MSDNEAKRLMDTITNAIDTLGSDHNMRRDRPYTGQPHTDTGERGRTEIKGITFRDLHDCYIRAVLLSTGGGLYHKDPETAARLAVLYDEANKGENAVLCENDVYGFDFDKLDPMAISQNLSCEIERLMGIFPNIPKDDHET